MVNWCLEFYNFSHGISTVIIMGKEVLYKVKIAVAGTGYVGLSNAVLLAQHNEVIALDIMPEKVNMINNRKSPITDKEIEEFLATKDLNLTATTYL